MEIPTLGMQNFSDMQTAFNKAVKKQSLTFIPILKIE
jgi:hypothetical protein